ncbi:dienelactone hydrolase family protein [Paraburkholderia sp. CNPSo 3076]|uniref:alpha/beta hydrolase n=1 Tax=Paraburkholderia sp. CNPSo 3076 TaxID=2940936 RepID=UPI00225A59EC|nr:dienelactone hydrolase family protein [Paraburkholderia sp. CNPSo 3076]MCX5541482.1 dienelactone hydrolase family protein [Paraburkholderia sp. CNPSo 3076]
MNEPTRRDFLAVVALGGAGLVAGCASLAGRNPHNLEGSMMMRKVSFKRDGLTLAGNLFEPENFNESGRYPAVVVAGSLSSVKEQMAGAYGRKLAENGFVALAIDYSHYGESEGQPRQLESPAAKLSDLKAAVSYLTALPYTKAVGMVGVCTSAGSGAYLVADDPRVKAFATIAAFLPDPELNERLVGTAEIARRRAAGAEAKLRFERSGEQVTVPTYSVNDPSALNYNPKGNYDYYFNKARGGVPEWKNEFAVMSHGPWLDFDPMSKALAIEVPTIMVHSGGCAFPEQAKKFYSLLGAVKELAWGDGTHFDYYDQPAQIDYAVKNVAAFLHKHLS